MTGSVKTETARLRPGKVFSNHAEILAGLSVPKRFPYFKSSLGMRETDKIPVFRTSPSFGT